MIANEEDIMESKENQPEARRTNVFGIIAGIFGIFFILFDIGSDIALAYQYHQDTHFYRMYPEIMIKKTNITTRYNISRECVDQYLCPSTTATSTFPTSRCKFLIREKLQIDPPKYQLEGLTFDAMWATISFIGLGGLVQTIIAFIIVLTQRENCPIRPRFLRSLVLGLSPILLGPVPIYVSLVFRSIKGVTEGEVLSHNVVAGTLKMGELFFESIPQLVVNAWSLLWRCGRHGDYQKSVYSSIGFAKGISITTSILAISYGISSWIMKVASKRKEDHHFVSKEHYPWTSFLGLFSWTLISLLSYFTGVINIYGNIHFSNSDDSSFMETFKIMFLLLVLRAVLLALIFFSACFNTSFSKKFKLIVSTIHLLLVASFIVCIAYFSDKPLNKRVIATLILFFLQLLLGALILPSPELGAKVLNPFVQMLFYLLERITCGKLDRKIDEWKKWKKEDEEDKNVEEAVALVAETRESATVTRSDGTAGMKSVEIQNSIIE